MGRVQKDVVSYFPHDADASTGDTLTVLQSRFGNDGYAFWFKLKEKLASTDGHYLDCRNSIKWQLLLARAGVNETTGVGIMNLLVEIRAIDKDLWASKLIWCQDLVDDLTEVYKNRRRKVPQKPLVTDKYCFECGKLLVDMRSDAKFCSDNCRQKAPRANLSVTENIVEKPISTDNSGISTPENPITTGESTQSRVEYSRVDKNTPYNPPKGDEVMLLKTERNQPEENLTVASQRHKKGESKRKQSMTQAYFDKFWEAYPRKRNRGQAEKTFEKVAPDEQLMTAILTAIEQAKKSAQWLKDDGQYIPYPATWLNAKGWEDEFPQKGANDGEGRGHPGEARSLKESITRPFLTKPPGFLKESITKPFG